MQIGLVGSTNVGKSTLFNRLIRQFRAIVTDIPGTTTDILYHSTSIDDLGDVVFADSPGLLEFHDERPFIQKIIDESHVILFVIDDVVGITAKEQHIFEYIQNSNKKNQTILVINKLDKKRKEAETELALSEYYSLGFQDVVGISAKTKRNLGELQDILIKKKYLLESTKKKSREDEFTDKQRVSRDNGIPIAILGKPNAGKSTLLNTLVGKQLSKVENIPGTTRDYVIGSFNIGNIPYTIYDTAGIKKNSTMHVIEKIAFKKTMDMLEYVRPVVIFVIDATLGISHRDMTLLEEINRLALPIIFALNKSDLLSKKEMENIIKATQRMMDFAKYIPIMPISALKGTGTNEFFTFVHALRKESEKRIGTTELNKIITTEFFQRPPRFPKNKICKIMYITQVDINAPTFLVFVNHKTRANFSFKKWIDNSIRKHFGFVGVPLVIRFKDRKEGNEDRSAPGESIETLEKIKEKRAEEMERKQKRVLVKRKIKKAK
ncbi:MAG: ribosome biogenesis GTPase Der [Candidatus Absconditabacteria bacterium]|nr:ribosome biogenesis GTPase Der [Candidatus Absconditabacteria bacterium]